MLLVAMPLFHMILLVVIAELTDDSWAEEKDNEEYWQ